MYNIYIAGLPAISVPVGFCKEGFPLGLQVIGRWMDEVTRAIELIKYCDDSIFRHLFKLKLTFYFALNLMLNAW